MTQKRLAILNNKVAFVPYVGWILNGVYLLYHLLSSTSIPVAISRVQLAFQNDPIPYLALLLSIPFFILLGSIFKREKRAQGRFRALFENAVDAIYIRDPDGKLRYVNKKFEEMHGVNRRDVIGKDSRDLLSLSNESIKQIEKSGSRELLEAPYERPDGSTGYLQVNLSRNYDEDENEHEVFGIVRDITDLKLSEQQLVESQQKFEMAFQASPDAISITTPDEGLYLDVNDSFLAITGFDRDEIIGRSIEDLKIWVDPRDRERLVSELQISGHIRDLEFQARKKSGEFMDASMSASSMMLNNRPVILSISKDITQRKRLEEAVKQSEERYRDLVENSMDMICTHRISGEILSANQTLVKNMGFQSEAEVIGQNIRDWLSPDTRGLFEYYIQALEAQGYASGLMKVVAPNGQRHILEFHNSLRTTGSDEPIVRGVSHDVTDRIRSEAALKNQNQYLEALHQTTLGLLDQFNIDELLHDILQRACDVSRTQHGYLALLSSDESHMEIRYGTGLQEDQIGFCIKIDEGLVGRVWRSTDSLHIQDYGNWDGRIKDDRFEDISSVIGIPLMAQDRVVGVIGLTRHGSERAFKNWEISNLEQFAKLAALALNNAKLYADLQKELGDRIEAESNLKRLASFPEQNPNPIIEVDISGSLTYQNPAATAAFPDLSSDPEKHPVLADFREIADVLSTDTVSSTTREIQVGTLFYGQKITYVQENQLFRFFCFDITDIKRAEESLRFSDEVLSRVNNIVIVADTDGDISYVSPSVKEILGYEAEELLGEGWWELSRDDPEDRAKEKAYVAACVRGEQPLNEEPYERLLKTKDGKEKWILFADAPGAGNLVIGVGYDITDRKQLETELLQSESKYRDLIANANDGIYTLNRHGRYTSFNYKAEELTGYTEEELLGKPHSLLLPKEEHSKARKTFVENLKGKSNRFELTINRKDGSQKTLEISTRPLFEDGKIMGNQGIARDITERKELDRMKTEFISMVSHELRTPLTSIKGYTDLMYSGDAGSLTDEQSEFLGIIAQNTTRLTNLINDLLDIERLESKQIKLEKRKLDLSEILHDVANTYRVSAHSKHLEFTSDIQPGLLTRVDPERMIQIFGNLVSNAIKYTKEGHVGLSASIEGEFIRIKIEDSGIGMSQDDASHVFDKFFRSTHEYTREVGGTGLGLAIVKSALEQHDGFIEVSSELGRGSTFVVSLPYLADKSGEKKRISEADRITKQLDKRSHVLIIEDEYDIAHLIRTYIEKMDCQVSVAHSGEEGIEIARELHPDLITLDVLLPSLNGFDTISKLKEYPETREIPVVFLSIVQDKERGFQLGASAYLNKPIDETTLRHTLKKFLNDQNEPILIVDDDTDFRQLLCRMLEREGYRTEVAHDGDEALKMASKNKYQLILLDKNMPNKSGLDVLLHLRSDELSNRTPVIMVSGSVTAEEMESQIEVLGAQKFLSKRLDVQEIVEEVMTFLDNNSGNGQKEKSYENLNG